MEGDHNIVHHGFAGEECSRCAETGTITVACTACIGMGYHISVEGEQEACAGCEGYGEVYVDCPKCNGAGFIADPKNGWRKSYEMLLRSARAEQVAAERASELAEHGFFGIIARDARMLAGLVERVRRGEIRK